MTDYALQHVGGGVTILPPRGRTILPEDIGLSIDDLAGPGDIHWVNTLLDSYAVPTEDDGVTLYPVDRVAFLVGLLNEARAELAESKKRLTAAGALERLASLTERHLTPGQAVEEAIALYLALGAEIADLETARAAAKTAITDVIVETGLERFETGAGMAYVSKPSARVTWDAKGLDALAGERPDLAELLEPYRQVKEVAGSLVVRAGGKGV